MILAAHQPQFMPWLGYLDKMRHCDVFVILDDVQFKKNEWQNRNRIWSKTGPQWLTVPVLHKFPQNIDDVEINNLVNWREVHFKTIRQNYSGSAFWDVNKKEIEKFYSVKWTKLIDVNMESIIFLNKKLGINPDFRMSSELGAEGKSTERLVNICKKLGADTYLAGAGGKEYMDLPLFDKAGIKVVFQEYAHPRYAQPEGGFVPNLSALDILLNHGANAAGIFKV